MSYLGEPMSLETSEDAYAYSFARMVYESYSDEPWGDSAVRRALRGMNETARQGIDPGVIGTVQNQKLQTPSHCASLPLKIENIRTLRSSGIRED